MSARPTATPGSASPLARLLRPMLLVGVYGSYALIALGVLVCFLHHPGYLFSNTDLEVLKSPGSAKVDVTGVMCEAARLHGQGLVLVGLMLLMATPFLGVALSLAYFVRERQRAFVIIAATVLALLLLSLLLGSAAA